MEMIIKIPRRSNPPTIIVAIAQIGIARLVPPLHTALRELVIINIFDNYVQTLFM